MIHREKMMGLIFCGIRALIILVVVGLVCGNPALATEAEPGVRRGENPQILWKVQSPQNTIFLAGSIHVLQKEQKA